MAINSNTIPRIIFQTWKTHEVPHEWKHAQESIIQMNRTWKYVLLTDDDNLRIVNTHFPDFTPYFVNFPHNIQRADAIRYIIMYVYGGIYVDLDYVALRSFDALALAKEVGLIPSNNVRSIVTNSFIISQPRSTFWLQCIEEMKKPLPFWSIGKHLQVYKSTGPYMIHKVYKRNLDVVEVLNIAIPCSTCEIDHCDTIEDGVYYLKPIRGLSWNAWDTNLFNWIYCHSIILFFIVFLALCAIVLYRLQ